MMERGKRLLLSVVERYVGVRVGIRMNLMSLLVTGSGEGSNRLIEIKGNLMKEFPRGILSTIND
jgi:hypothetical protein